MKLICIGDIHGRDIWKKIVKKEHDADKVIFMGDYFDSFDVPVEKQIKNFSEILKYMSKNPEKVVLLIGNHDYHYMSFVDERYSGYNTKNSLNINGLIMSALPYMRIAYQEENYFFTHAGVTNTWAKTHYVESYNKPTREMFFMLKNCPKDYKFNPSNPLDNWGDSITQSPIWVRPRALESDLWNDGGNENMIQVVGHTHQEHLLIKDKVIYTDTFDHCNEYLIIKDGKPEVGNI